MSAWSRLLLVAIAMGMAGTAPAGAAVGNRSLTVPDLQSNQIEVRFNRDGETGERKGITTLLVRNRANGRRVVRIRYLPSGNQGFTAKVAARSPTSKEDGGIAGRGGKAIVVRPHEVATFRVTFAAKEPDSTPEQADGRLVLTSQSPNKRRVVGAPLVLMLSGARAEERGITINPESVTLPVTLHQPEVQWPLSLRDPLEIHTRDYGEAYVELRGPGAAALTEAPRTIETVLRREDGLSVKVKLRAIPLDDNVTRLVLPDGNVQISHPGKYTGTLPLGSGESAPSLELVVEAKEWLGWAVLVVLLGVLLGRLVPPFLRKERKRRRGRVAIADAIRVYGTARRGRPEAASYDLDWLIAPARWQLRGVLTRPQDEPARLLRDLNEGSEHDELDTAVSNARALRARVDRWAQVERAARGLLDELESRAAQRRRYAKPTPDASAVSPADDPMDPNPVPSPRRVLVGRAVLVLAVAAIVACSLVTDVGGFAWFSITIAIVLLVLAPAVLTTQSEDAPRLAGAARLAFALAVAAIFITTLAMDVGSVAWAIVTLVLAAIAAVALYVAADPGLTPPKVLISRLALGLALTAIIVTTLTMNVGSLAWFIVTAGLALVVAAAAVQLGIENRRGRTWRFADTKAADDAYAVLGTLGTQPSFEGKDEEPTKKQIAELAARCVTADRERRAIHGSLDVWRRLDRLEGRALSGTAVATRDTNEVDAIWAERNPKRDAPTYRWLLRRLERADSDLKGLQRQFRPGGDPSAAWAQAAFDRVIAYLLWAAEAALRTAVQLVASVLRSILSVVLAIGRRLAGLWRGWFAVAQVVSLLLTLSVPVLVYVLTLYTTTWGSALDILTAFAAGFAGKLALDFGTNVRLPQLGSAKEGGETDHGSGKTVEQRPPGEPDEGNGAVNVPAGAQPGT